MLYDGESAQGRQVEVVPTAIDIDLSAPDGFAATVAAAVLRSDARRPPRFVLHRTDQPDWRLVFATPPPPGALPIFKRAGAAGVGTKALVVVGGGGVIATAAALWVFGAPLLGALAPLVPHDTLAPIGAAMVAQIGGKRCTAPAGEAALAALTVRLTPAHGIGEPVDVRITDAPYVNALAAPGGQIVVFRGLIDAAASSDEIAGVLAHELAHVQHRDATKALLRQMGLSLLVQSIGGTMGNVADTALLLDGSRTAEADADAGALTLLAEARISPGGLAQFFKRLQAKAAAKHGATILDRVASYAATHPADSDRAATITASRTYPATSALTPAQWRALRTICSRTA